MIDKVCMELISHFQSNMQSHHKSESNKRIIDAIFHPLVRLASLRTFGLAQINPIEEHNAIFAKYGEVAFAKFGGLLVPSSIHQLKNAVIDGTNRKLYVAYKTNSEYIAFVAPIKSVAIAGKPSKLIQPTYYTKLGFSISYWFILSGMLKPCSLNRLWVASNGRLLKHSLEDSRSSLMYVTTTMPACAVEERLK